MYELMAVLNVAPLCIKTGHFIAKKEQIFVKYSKTHL